MPTSKKSDELTPHGPPAYEQLAFQRRMSSALNDLAPCPDVKIETTEHGATVTVDMSAMRPLSDAERRKIFGFSYIWIPEYREELEAYRQRNASADKKAK